MENHTILSINKGLSHQSNEAIQGPISGLNKKLKKTIQGVVATIFLSQGAHAATIYNSTDLTINNSVFSSGSINGQSLPGITPSVNPFITPLPELATLRLNQAPLADGWVKNNQIDVKCTYGSITVDGRPTELGGTIANPNFGKFSYKLGSPYNYSMVESMPDTTTCKINWRYKPTGGTLQVYETTVNLALSILTPGYRTINGTENHAPVTISSIESNNDKIKEVFPDTINNKAIVPLGTNVPVTTLPFVSTGGIVSFENNQTEYSRVFTPKLDYTKALQSYQFKYRIANGDGIKNYNSITRTVNIPIINETPTESPIEQRTFITNKGSILNGNILVNNPEKKEVLTYLITATPTLGNVVIQADGKFTYTPIESMTGLDSFTVKITDQAGQSISTIINLTITENSSPIGSSHGLSGYINGEKTGQLIGNDTDAGDTLTYNKISQSTGGDLLINPDGTYKFTPTPGFYGTFTAQYRVTDQLGASGTGTITIDVYDTIFISWTQSTHRENGDVLQMSEIKANHVRYHKISDNNTYEYIELSKEGALGSDDPASDESESALRYYNEDFTDQLVSNGAACYRIVSSTVIMPLDIDKTTMQISTEDMNGLPSNFVAITPGTDETNFIECKTK